MSGIVFFTTTERSEIVDFYTERLGFDPWLEQTACTILRNGNLLLGFCDGEQTEDEGVVTVYLDSRNEVEEWYSRLEDVAIGDPVENERFEIFQFFGEDPDGRTFEIQTFLHDLPPEP